MTLKCVERNGVTRLASMSTRTTSVVKAPVSANCSTSQWSKSVMNLAPLDEGHLGNIPVEQGPERSRVSGRVPAFKFCKRVDHCGVGGRGVRLVRRSQIYKHCFSHGHKPRQHRAARVAIFIPAEFGAEQCQAVGNGYGGFFGRRHRLSD